MRVMKKWRELIDREEGQAIVLFAAVMVALTGVMALSVDAGLLYASRARLQAVTDMAALAGVSVLHQGQQAAEDATWDIIQANDFAAYVEDVQVDLVRRRVFVQTKRHLILALAPTLGISSGDVNAEAKAVQVPVTGIRGATPLGVIKADWVPGQLVTLKGKPGQAPGNYGGLALGGRGAATFKNNLANGYDQWLHVGDVIETEPGNMAGPTSSASTARIQAAPHETWDTTNPKSPRVLRVVIVDQWPKGRGTLNVVGFALFFLESNNGGDIQGRFVKMVIEGEGAENAPDLGAYVVKMVRD